MRAEGDGGREGDEEDAGLVDRDAEATRAEERRPSRRFVDLGRPRAAVPEVFPSVVGPVAVFSMKSGTGPFFLFLPDEAVAPKSSSSLSRAGHGELALISDCRGVFRLSKRLLTEGCGVCF